MSKRLYVKYTLCLSDFKETWIFSIVSKKGQISSFMKIRVVRAELSHADGRTDRQTDRDMMKLIVAFRNFANAPKNPWRWCGDDSFHVANAFSATGWTVWGSNAGGGEIFCTRLDRP